MEIKIINKSTNELPSYATALSAGMDIRANLPKEGVSIMPNERCVIPTGLHIALPKGVEAQIRPRSGLAAKHGVTVLNSPGTIDADYRGEIGVILINHGEQPFQVQNGDRIAQMVIAKHETITWELVGALDETDRGDGGFGHSGVK